MKINEIIREKRKERKLTQEEVADYLGVSAPAVNKWENGINYPDITLLPPLARLLHTDLNTLLSFHEDLSHNEVGIICNELSIEVQTNGFQSGFELAMTKLAEFPNCDLLVINLAAALQGALFIFAPELSEEYNEKIQELYLRASKSENQQIRDQALGFLLSDASARDDFEEAQSLLDQVSPPSSIDKETMQARLYIRQENYDEASRLLEQKLLRSATEISNTLDSMMTIALKQGRNDDARYFADLSRNTAINYDLMGCCADIAHLQLAVATEDADACIRTLESVLTGMEKRWDINASRLYRHIPGKNGEETFSSSLLSTMVKQIQTDEEMAFVREHPDFIKLMKRFTKDEGSR
ncbi:helix-turn-helix domain-containing protein [Anaerolentibacter hominis]|uniref:helix-turn-helix domain-containing protein n=1 Tax=Anaerolentibacter hominis TaxID=3079009 RepID=UPI0031B7F2E2